MTGEGVRAELREAAQAARVGAAEPWTVFRSAAQNACHVRDNKREWVAQFTADEATAAHIAAASPAAVLALLAERDALAEQVDGSSHWLIFNAAREITGCHCGFPADIERDCGYGDSVVDHIADVAASRRCTGNPTPVIPDGVAEQLGWWTIAGSEFLTALRRCESGDPADAVYAEFYANSDHEFPAGGTP